APHKRRLAADAHEATRTVDASGLVDEVAERLAALQGCHVLAPMFRLRREVGGDIPAALPHQLAPFNPKAALLREIGEVMFRAGRPEPIRRRLGIVAEPLFALPEVIVGALQALTHGLECRDDLVEFVLVLGRAPPQAQWRRRVAERLWSEKYAKAGAAAR